MSDQAEALERPVRYKPSEITLKISCENKYDQIMNRFIRVKPESISGGTEKIIEHVKLLKILKEEFSNDSRNYSKLLYTKGDVYGFKVSRDQRHEVLDEVSQYIDLVNMELSSNEVDQISNIDLDSTTSSYFVPKHPSIQEEEQTIISEVDRMSIAENSNVLPVSKVCSGMPQVSKLCSERPPVSKVCTDIPSPASATVPESDSGGENNLFYSPERIRSVPNFFVQSMPVVHPPTTNDIGDTSIVKSISSQAIPNYTPPSHIARQYNTDVMPSSNHVYSDQFYRPRVTPQYGPAPIVPISNHQMRDNRILETQNLVSHSVTATTTSSAQPLPSGFDSNYNSMRPDATFHQYSAPNNFP